MVQIKNILSNQIKMSKKDVLNVALGALRKTVNIEKNNHIFAMSV